MTSKTIALHFLDDYLTTTEKENSSVLFCFSRAGSNMSPNTQLEHEKRVRREIANSNERRRMQSINTGFQSLKILIPHSCGEKLSKVCYAFHHNTICLKKECRGKKKVLSQGQTTVSSKI